MSGPNKSYDPVQVAPLDAAHVEAMVAAALAAFQAATSVAELKQARLAHAGDRSPIALANREIGALPPQARKDAGSRIGQARGTINQALKAREGEISAAELERTLAEERVDVTLPVATQPVGAVHPVTALMHLMEDVFVGMGWEVAEGPELEAEWMNFDALNFIPDHPANHAGHAVRRIGHRRSAAADPHFSGAGPRHAHPRAADLRGLPRTGLPGRRVRRDAPAGLPPDRGARDRQGAHPRSPARHP